MPLFPLHVQTLSQVLDVHVSGCAYRYGCPARTGVSTIFLGVLELGLEISDVPFARILPELLGWNLPTALLHGGAPEEYAIRKSDGKQYGSCRPVGVTRLATAFTIWVHFSLDRISPAKFRTNFVRPQYEATWRYLRIGRDKSPALALARTAKVLEPSLSANGEAVR